MKWRKGMDVYIDGACKSNPGPGGWAVYLDKDVYFSGREDNTTNNRMEIRAALEALKFFKEEDTFHFYTDSKYLRDAASVWIKTWYKNGWRTSARKAVKNKDLWLEYLKLSRGKNITWTWLRGHSGHEGNEAADTLASDAAMGATVTSPIVKAILLEQLMERKNEN